MQILETNYLDMLSQSLRLSLSPRRYAGRTKRSMRSSADSDLLLHSLINASSGRR
jgi:hypothetical protein